MRHGLAPSAVKGLHLIRDPRFLPTIFWFTSAGFRIIEPRMTYDVAIIGGGPAGSVAGAALARNGRRVVILEKKNFPRFRVGESLLPASSDTFQRIGVKKSSIVANS